ncbi:O-antigen ligase family protein [Caulobacter vibrioides]|uniref:O-antigen ligase family protein n=1 Tax=Caulobacter vibrioides TaxID=155892 RepID=A0A290MN64_CAUVI|nr:O-antigen ligase [Caulobacter vibrioides]ATC33451.1 O-antigen ligase family protein [Caulobacter vibrioides]
MRTKTRLGAGSSSPRSPGARRLKLSEGVAIGALLTLILAEIVAFGASELAVSSLFGVLHALFLLTLLATCGWARKAATLRVNPALWLPFALLLVMTAWALTPFGPGGPHPVWLYVEPKGGSITVDRSSLILNIIRLGGLACLFLAAQLIGVSETRRRALFWFLLLALGAYAALTVLQHVTTRATGRLTGTLLSPNTIATLMGVCTVFAAMFVTQFIQRADGRLSLDKLPLDASISLVLVAVFAVALAFTASRGGIFATVVALAILLIWQVIAQGKKARVVVMIGGAAVLLLAIGLAMRSADVTAARLENLDSDVATRQAIFTAHWLAFKGSPWFGYGLGSFPVVNQLVMTSETLGVLYDVRATHNLYLQWLEEAGLAGALSMLVLLGVLLWQVGLGAAKPGTSGALSRAAIAATVLVLLHGMSDFAVQAPALQALFAVGLGALAVSPPSSRPGRLPVFKDVPTFAGIVLVASLLSAAPLVAARFGGDLSVMPTAPAEALASRIEAGLASGATDRVSLDRLEALSRREVAMRPGAGSAWLRKAAVDFKRGDFASANEALGRSYAVAPLHTSAFLARTRLAYEHWGYLTPAVRAQVIYQVRVEYKRSGGDKRLTALANSLQNPSGRIGLALLIVAERLTKAAAQ